MNRIVEYSIFDPTGNITALVRTEVDPVDQPFAAGRIMACHPEVEQVGFVHIEKPGAGNDCLLPELRMAGGEFCGNASMSAAAIYLIEKKINDEEAGSDAVFLKVSGVRAPVEVRLREESPGSYQGSVLMPAAREIQWREFSLGDVKEALPIVRMEGISHIIIEDNKRFFGLADKTDEAELAVRTWCDQLSAQGLGLMFFEGNNAEYRLTPLVYVPGSDTVYWENSCASGTSSVGMYLAWTKNRSVDLTMEEPGGILRVESDPSSDRTWLHGRVRLVKNLKMDLYCNPEQ